MKTIYPFMGLALCGVAAQAQEKPNFLIIQCDHLTQRVVGAYGQTQGCTDTRKPFFRKRLRSRTLRKNTRHGLPKRIQTQRTGSQTIH
mgnify:CR=1 FL=1